MPEFNTHRFMYYRSFLNEYREWYGLSTNEQIVYSILLNKAILHQEVFDFKGELSQEMVKDRFEDEDYFEMPKMSLSKISEKSGISLRTLKGENGIIAQLRKRDLLDYDYNNHLYSGETMWVKSEYGVFKNGYMTLPIKTGLKGKQLVFWAFMLERLKHYNKKLTSRKGYNYEYMYNNKMYVCATKLAADFGVSTKDIHNLIHQLTARNFLKRDVDIRYLYINTQLKNIKTVKEVRAEKAKLSRANQSVIGEQSQYYENNQDDDLFALPF